MDNDKFYLDKKAYRWYMTKNIFAKTLMYAFLIALALFIIMPFYWMINTSLKSAYEIDRMIPTLLPESWRFYNYFEIFHRSENFGRYFLNTFIVGACTTTGMLFTTILAAFAFSRLRFPGRDILFSALLMTMMVPGEMYIITNYVTVTTFKGIDQYWAMIVPFTASVFNIFFLRQSFRQIPDELYLAAKVDGTSDFKYLRRIMIPIARPTIITITILSLFGAWNAFIWPRLIVRSDSMKLISNGLMSAFSNESEILFHLQMAASAVVTLPLLIAFMIFKKYIVRGVSRAGIKG